MSLEYLRYIPKEAIKGVTLLFKDEAITVSVKNERKTRFGDYRMLSNGEHQITINNSLNPFRFLITLIHEFSHYKAYQKFGKTIKPHGKEWKATFAYFMSPFLNTTIFPPKLLPLLVLHLKNPKASTATDVKLLLALQQYDANTDKTYIFDIPYGSLFTLRDGRTFKKGKRRVKRYECIDIRTGILYLISPHAEVKSCKE